MGENCSHFWRAIDSTRSQCSKCGLIIGGFKIEGTVTGRIVSTNSNIVEIDRDPATYPHKKESQK